MVGTRMKIMWEEQLVDPSNEKITPLYLSDHNKQGANMKNITIEYMRGMVE